MKKEQARRWLQQWLKHQQQVTKASVLGLAGLAAGASGLRGRRAQCFSGSALIGMRR